MKSFRKNRSVWFTLLSMGMLLLVGCGSKTSDALNTDAHGYQCQKCKLKFYTDQEVWAEFCPVCKASGPPSIAQLVCPKDGQTWIAEPGGDTKCAKCGALVEASRPPRAKDLQAWGAVKKTQQEVCAK